MRDKSLKPVFWNGRWFLLVFLSALLAGPIDGLAQEVDPSVVVVPDSLFTEDEQPGPTYQSVFDRDRTRSNWIQTLSYARSTRRLAFNGSGMLTTQDLRGAQNKTTFGDFSGHLDGRLTRRWTLSLDGRFGMNSALDATRDEEIRENRINIRTQYQASPIVGLSLTGGLYTEFQQEHSRATRTTLNRASPFIDPDAVDTLSVQRDSSFTSARQDGLSALATWRIQPWLDFYGTVAASRRLPTQRSFVRDFDNPLDSAGVGTSSSSSQVTREPSDNSAYTSRLTITRIPLARFVLGYTNTSVDQTRFDQELRGQENLSLDRTVSSLHLDYGPFHRTNVILDGSLTRSISEFQLRRTSNAVVTTRQLSSTVSYSDGVTISGATFQVSRSRNERQLAQNGITLSRSLGANASRKLSRRLAIDGVGNLTLLSSQYQNTRGDQDIVRSYGNVGGGYLLARQCSTTVHLGINRSHTVSLHPSASSGNNVFTIYQVTAGLRYAPNPNFVIRQDYFISTEYKIFDFSESQNFVNRVRRIDTDFVDSLFSFAFLRLNHSFIYRDNGGFSRRPGESVRRYGVAIESYEQTLTGTVGIDMAPGVRFLAIHSIYNQRNLELARNARTLRNRFTLNLGLEVSRTLPGGSQIVGAVRHIGGYDEKTSPTTDPREEDYWIAGATFQKTF